MSIPTFFHTTEVRVNGMKALAAIPYREDSFYIFDRGFNDFKWLYAMESIGAYIVIKGKMNNDFRPMKWKRRFLRVPTSSEAIGYMDGQPTMGRYSDKIRRVIYWDEENESKFIFFTNAFIEDERQDINPIIAAELYHNRWKSSCFKWLKQYLKTKNSGAIPRMLSRSRSIPLSRPRA